MNLNCKIKSDTIKELGGRAIIEDFAREIIDPLLHESNSFV